MENLINEYPKAIAALLIGVSVTYLTGKISPEYLSPVVIQSAQLILTGIAATIFGRFIRLTRTEAKVLKDPDNKNQIG